MFISVLRDEKEFIFKLILVLMVYKILICLFNKGCGYLIRLVTSMVHYYSRIFSPSSMVLLFLTGLERCKTKFTYLINK